MEVRHLVLTGPSTPVRLAETSRGDADVQTGRTDGKGGSETRGRRLLLHRRDSTGPGRVVGLGGTRRGVHQPRLLEFLGPGTPFRTSDGYTRCPGLRSLPLSSHSSPAESTRSPPVLHTHRTFLSGGVHNPGVVSGSFSLRADLVDSLF